jgi:hypothetical protein
MSDKGWEAMAGLERPDTVIQPQASAAAVALPAIAPEAYAAFGQEHPELRGEVIEVRYGEGAFCQIERRFLVRVEGAGDHFLALICTNYAVLIEGRGLADLRRRLSARKVDFIQELDRRRWPVVLSGVPVVEKIELLQADGPLSEGLSSRRAGTSEERQSSY